MKRHIIKLKYAVALVGVFLTAVFAVPEANSTYICGETTKCLRIIYGGNFMGNIAPCGWSENQAGGLSRQKTLIDRIKESYGDEHTLVLNSGNNFDMTAHDSDLSSNYIVKAFSLSGIEIIGPGVSEIAYGVEPLKEILSRSKVQAVSANVPGFEPYALLSKNNGRTRILVTSVVDPDLLATQGIGIKGLRDPMAAIEDVRRQIRHDLFVLIVHGSKEKIAALVRACPEIDLVIDALSRNISENPEQTRQPAVISNNEEGMYVAYVDYQGKNPAGALFSSPVALRAAVGEVAEDPGIVELLKDYESKRAAGFPHQSQSASASLTDEAVAQEKTNAPYVGSRSCNLCHEEINGQWSKTPHAGAMHSLVAKSRETDPNCISCHVTGMAKNDPKSVFFKVSEVPPFMTGVQCEACHGPGAAHSQDPMAVDMLSATEKTCVRCHTGRTDPDFDYDRDIPRVIHGRVKMGYNGP